MKRNLTIIGVLLAVVLVAAAGYWLSSKPPSPYFSRSLTGETENLIGVRIDPSGYTVIATSSNGEVALWPLAGSAVPSVKKLSGFAITSFGLTNDDVLIAGDSGRHLLSWYRDLGDVKTAKELPGVVTSIAFRPEGKGGAGMIAATNQGMLLSYEDGRLRKLEVPKTTLKTLSIHQSGNVAVAGTESGHLVWINPSTMSVEATTKHEKTEISGTVFSPDGSQLVSVDWNGKANVWSTKNKTVEFELQLRDGISSVDWTKHGLVLGTWSGELVFWLPADRKPYLTISTDRPIHSLDVHREQNMLVTVSNGNRVDVWKIPDPR